MVILTFWCCYFVIKTNENKLIEAWNKAVVAFVALAYFSLEILSVFSMITRTALFIFWAIVFVVLLILSFHLIKKEKGSLNILATRIFRVIKYHKTWCILAIALLFLAV